MRSVPVGALSAPTGTLRILLVSCALIKHFLRSSSLVTGTLSEPVGTLRVLKGGVVLDDRVLFAYRVPAVQNLVLCFLGAGVALTQKSTGRRASSFYLGAVCGLLAMTPT